MADPKFGDEMKRHLTAVEHRVTGKRYCTNCDKLQPPEGGVKVRYRWMCRFCDERRRTRAGRS